VANSGECVPDNSYICCCAASAAGAATRHRTFDQQVNALQITPSGGLIGFRIAEDLLTKEYKEDKEKPEILLGGNHNE